MHTDSKGGVAHWYPVAAGFPPSFQSSCPCFPNLGQLLELVGREFLGGKDRLSLKQDLNIFPNFLNFDFITQLVVYSSSH